MKKVLIITYYWPPSGGPGVQRVLKFAKYLPNFGWQPIILTVKTGNYPTIDESLVKEIPPDCKVYKTNIFEPFNFYKSITGKTNENIPTFVLNKSEKESITEKLSKWIRANLFIPDAKIGWARNIVTEGLEVIKVEKPDLIFSSSPPHSLQIGAMRLAKKTGLPWIADFRDPWTDAFWQKDIKRNFISALVDERFEKLVFNNASRITTVSKIIANDISRKSKSKVTLIPNGFDESDFNYTKSKTNKFRITYTGTLGKSQSISGLIKSLECLPDNLLSLIDVNLIGSFHNSIINEINSSKIRKHFNVRNPIPHEESIKEITNADLLLLVIPDTPNNKGILTGKIFEYLATGNPILCYAPKDGDAAEIINETKSGLVFSYDEDASDFIINLINKFVSDELTINNKNNILHYSRKNLTERLSGIFNEFV